MGYSKVFFPKSANELCQVAKVNESLMSMKYLFPIEERQLKSTSVIQTETENLKAIVYDIENSENIKTNDKLILLAFANETKKTIPLLTNNQMLENETRIKIKEITQKINNLTNDFSQKDFPIESNEDEIKRIESAEKEGNWELLVHL